MTKAYRSVFPVVFLAGMTALVACASADPPTTSGGSDLSSKDSSTATATAPTATATTTATTPLPTTTATATAPATATTPAPSSTAISSDPCQAALEQCAAKSPTTNALAVLQCSDACTCPPNGTDDCACEDQCDQSCDGACMDVLDRCLDVIVNNPQCD